MPLMKSTTIGRYAVMAMADLASFKDHRPCQSYRYIFKTKRFLCLTLERDIHIKLKGKNLVSSVRGAKGRL